MGTYSAEHNRRIEVRIARAAACHMSNTKWRKLFIALGQLGVGRMTWKFIDSDHLYYQPPPPEWALLETCQGDFGIAPAVAFREIDWVEVSVAQMAGVEEGLAALGRFPIQLLPSGLRIVGYSW